MGRIASPTFVGRAAELAALDEALEAAEQGHTTTVLIGGDAGVGKTRLLDTWNERAREGGARIAAGSCLDLGESGPAYTSVIEALRGLFGGIDSAAEAVLVGPDRTLLARVFPELDDDADGAMLGHQFPRLAQTRLFERLVDVLHRAATEMPVVLELEDIHWADPSSRAFLLYLAQVSRHEKLLIIGTYRPDEADTDPAFRSTLGQLLRRPRVAKLPVAPFDEDELREQLSGILGAPPSAALLSAIHARSEGNALFAEELAATADPSADLPASVGDATATRIADLSAGARTVLHVASVVGRTTSYDVLRTVTSLDDAELADALREAVRARLLEPVHAGEGYRFRHALLQEAIYEDVLPGERRHLHAAVALALSEDPDDPPEDGDLAPRLARHWFEARDFDRAFRAARAAAAAAEHQSAYAEALTHRERMLDLWDRVTGPVRGMTAADLRERLAWAAFLAGDLGASARHGRLALVELAAAPDVSQQIRVLDQLAWTLSRLGEDPEEVSRQMAALDPDDRPAAERVLIQVHRVAKLNEDCRYAEALDLARPLLELARSEDDPALQVRTSMVVAGIQYVFDVDEALRMLDAARDLATRSGDDVLVADVNQELCEILFESRRHEGLLITAQEAVEFAGRAGLGRWARPQLRFYQAAAHLSLGHLTKSLEAIRLALLDEPTGRAKALLNVVAAQASTAVGAFGDAATQLEASRLPHASIEGELGRGWLATARAELALAQGHVEVVRRIVEATAPRLLGDQLYSSMSETLWWLAEVGLAAAAEQAESARAAKDDAALTDARAVAASLAGQVYQVRNQRDQAGVPDLGRHIGDEALIAGHLARVEGRDDPELWAAAAAAFPPRSPRGLAARYRQAEAMLAAKAPRDAVAAVMQSAHAAAVDIGAHPLSHRFEALARRARIELRPAIAAGPREVVELPADEPLAPGTTALRARGLSDREIEVLTLVAAGFSNREIGSRLFITAKTASVHVTHILAKLDATSRTEAATIGVRLGLPDVERDDRPG